MCINLNLLGMVLQAVGLILAAIRDLTKHHAENHMEKHGNTVHQRYMASSNGQEYKESAQEKSAWEKSAFAQKYDGLLPYSIAIAAIGTLMQIAEEVLK